MSENRIIKFRGQRKDGSGWAYGGIVYTDSCRNGVVKNHILIGSHLEELHEVDPATVGQMWIVNKNETFTGDLISINAAMGRFGEWKTRVGKIVSTETGMGILMMGEDGEWRYTRHYELDSCTIIGNEWDNHELLKGEQ